MTSANFEPNEGRKSVKLWLANELFQPTTQLPQQTQSTLEFSPLNSINESEGEGEWMLSR